MEEDYEDEGYEEEFEDSKEEPKDDLHRMLQQADIELPEPIHVPETNMTLLRSIAVGAAAVIIGLGGLVWHNYKNHTGPQKPVYRYEIKSDSKITGIASYVEYRKLESEFLENGKIDIIVKGNLLKRNEAYMDVDGDKDVDVIEIEYSNGRVIQLRRGYADDEEKVKFAEADRYFAKHFESFSK